MAMISMILATSLNDAHPKYLHTISYDGSRVHFLSNSYPLLIFSLHSMSLVSMLRVEFTQHWNEMHKFHHCMPRVLLHFEPNLLENIPRVQTFSLHSFAYFDRTSRSIFHQERHFIEPILLAFKNYIVNRQSLRVFRQSLLETVKNEIMKWF